MKYVDMNYVISGSPTALVSTVSKFDNLYHTVIFEGCQFLKKGQMMV